MLIKILSWALLLIPWLSAIFIPKSVIKRYMPVALFACVLVFIWNELGYTYDWWRFSYRIFPQIITDVSFVFGTFLIGTIWIFYLTFRRFWLYLILNMVMDAILAFPVRWGVEYVGLVKLVNYTSWNTFFTSVGLALIIYLYQLWQEGALIERWHPYNRINHEMSSDASKWFDKKEKAR